MKITRLYLPENLDIDQIRAFLKERGHNKNYIYKLLFVISTIHLVKVTNRTLKNSPLVPLSKVILGKFIRGNDVKAVRDYLVELGIIETQGKGIKGKECIRYGLTEAYREQAIKDMYCNFFAKKEVPTIKTKTESQAYIASHLEKLTICYNDAYESLLQFKKQNIDSYNSGVIGISLIEDKNWFFKDDENTGRVFHNVANLSRELRPFLRYEGKPLAEVDVSNCQPMLLHTLYPDKNCHEANRYLSLVESGKFYNLLLTVTDSTDRDKIKRGFLTYLFSTIGELALWKLPIEKAFTDYFPELAEIIRGLKKSNGIPLDRILQSLEATLVINTVVPILAQYKIPVITIHDSIMTLPEYVEVVKELLKGECEKAYGVVPNIKTKIAA